MPAPRETILAALPATALRGEVLPQRVPAAGLLILRDGEPGEPEVTLSPLAYHYLHHAEIEAVVQGADRDAAFDALTVSIGAAHAADRTLGGLYEDFQYQAPSWGKPRRVIAKIKWYPGELFPKIGFIVTNLPMDPDWVERFYYRLGTAEQHIKEGKRYAQKLVMPDQTAA